jgi:hypothetical protein
MVDWSEIGVWEPTADLGQTMISDVKPAVWREHDRRLVKMYWDRLVQNGVDASKFPFETCWKGYEVGGVQKWIWMFAFMSGFDKVPPVAVQYFHDQLLSFIEDHGDYPSYVLKPICCFINKAF